MTAFLRADRIFLSVALIGVLAGGCATPHEPGLAAPVAVPREFRAAWVATVANIDWPSKPGLSTAEQQGELVAILDRARELNLNAIVMQVRPMADALYASPLEPWSSFLCGEMGRAPEPFYDPLAFAVTEAHARGIELHAWFNPYRAWHPSAKGEASPGHVSQSRPELVRSYGRYLWMDPGDPVVRAHTLAVMDDVIRRYDIDGVHIDDYFYPYKERGEDGEILDFPDESSYAAFQERGGTLERDDFRRDAVNRFVEELYQRVRNQERPVKVGISPFGIWRPGHPAQIKGFDPYAELYADARLWLQEGWCDYFTPQLYWKVAPPQQSYTALLRWWSEQNVRERHLWPGNFTSRVGDGSAKAFPAEELVWQIQWTRIEPGAGGNVHFSMKPFMQDRAGLNQLLLAKVYAERALVPATPWLDDAAPLRPVVILGDPATLEIHHLEPADVRLWVVYRRSGENWRYAIEPGNVARIRLEGDEDEIRVSAVDASGNESLCAAHLRTATP